MAAGDWFYVRQAIGGHSETSAAHPNPKKKSLLKFLNISLDIKIVLTQINLLPISMQNKHYQPSVWSEEQSLQK